MDSRLRDSLESELRSEDEEVRRLAVERATALPEDEALDLLLARLGDPSWRVRKAACERISQLREPGRAAPALMAALADGDNPGRRNAALEVLRRIGTAALPSLLEASRDSDVDVRKQVVDALAGIDDPAAQGRLESLLSDDDANVRGAAADALGSCGSASAVDALRRSHLEDPEGLVRLSALRALARLEAELPLAELKGSLADPVLRPAAIGLLAESDDPEAEERLVESLHTARSAREAAMGALVRRLARLEAPAARDLCARVDRAVTETPAILEDVLGRLGAAPLPKRIVFVQFLCLLRRPDVVAPLLRAGLDPSLETLVLEGLAGFGEDLERAIADAFGELPLEARELALRLLGASHGAAGREVILHALESDSLELRVEAARALARRREPAVIPALVAGIERSAAELDDADDESLEALSDALIQVARTSEEASRDAVTRLSEIPPDACECHRIVAARALGELGRSSDSDTLSLLLSDPSERVRRAAVVALGRLAHGEPADALRLAVTDESPAVRIGAAGALVVARAPDALEGLETLARDEEPRVRAAAMRALAALPPGAGEERILAMLRNGLADEGSVAMASLEALKRIGGEAAAELATGLVSSEDADLAALAIGCVGRHGGDTLLEPVVAAVDHAAWSVRAAAVEVLVDRRCTRALPTLMRRLECEEDEFVRGHLLDALGRLEP